MLHYFKRLCLVPFDDLEARLRTQDAGRRSAGLILEAYVDVSLTSLSILVPNRGTTPPGR